MKTCPNEQCENNGTEFDSHVNYCEHCGTLLVLIDEYLIGDEETGA